MQCYQTNSLKVLAMMKMKDLYHGTTKQNADHISQNGFDAIYLPNFGTINIGNAKRKPGSLGYGLYSFVGDSRLALKFAQNFGSDVKGVVHFKVSFSEDYLLDLNDPEDVMYFNEWVNDDRRSKTLKRLRDKYSNRGNQKSLDCAIIEAYIWDMKKKRLLDKVDAISMTTHTHIKGEILDMSAIPNGTEFCVRNLDVVNEGSIEAV